jgi:TonB family protein
LFRAQADDTIVTKRASEGKPFVRITQSEQRPEAYNSEGVIYLLGAGIIRVKQDQTSVSGSAEMPREPQLALEKTGWLNQFASSVGVLVHGPAPPKKFLGDPYFRDCWIDQRFPKLAFLAAVALQILLILFPPPIWNIHPSRTISAAPRMELTWYGPVKDFPVILPAGSVPKPAPARNKLKTPQHRGADAFHPRQTIISEPLHPTHPRQTLIQPAAPQEPPKILPALPNIVRLADSQPARPKLQLTAEQLAAMRPKTPSQLTTTDTAAPDIVTPEKQTGVINIASSSKSPPKPVLPVSPMSAPRAAPQNGEANAAAPDIGGHTGDSETLIALSASPAPLAPPPAMPAGNPSPRFSISPDGPQPGAPCGPPKGSGAGGGSGNGGGGHGPEGISITGGNTADSAPISGLGIGSSARAPGTVLPSRPVPRARTLPEESKSPLYGSASANTAPKFGMAPEEVLNGKRVYTLHVNMPNMTSASGSWVLNFAELNDAPPGVYPGIASADLAGPVALRKVDPKYPPELRDEHVEGEVVLYAIIRKDGSVDSIQLVHSVDPHLDVNAMDALAQWKFRPAEKHGEPVDLEAVVHIPFRSRAPEF